MLETPPFSKDENALLFKTCQRCCQSLRFKSCGVDGHKMAQSSQMESVILEEDIDENYEPTEDGARARQSDLRVSRARPSRLAAAFVACAAARRAARVRATAPADRPRIPRGASRVQRSSSTPNGSGWT
jgi:hypothetical protein